ncbi:MAG: hypothetical protein R6W72_14095 [Desulfurivibrionaceae bacterium]
MSTDTRLSPFREDHVKKEKEPTLPLAEARMLAQQTMGVGGIDDIALGLAGFSTGILVSVLGEGDPGVLLSEAIIPAVIIFALLYLLSAKLKRSFVLPRVGKAKPPKVPGIFSFYSFVLYTGLHYSLGGAGQIAFWQTIAVAWCAATFNTAMFLWKPRFFAVPLAIVTLLRLQVAPDVLLMGVGLTYLAVGVAVFGRFLASADEGAEATV